MVNAILKASKKPLSSEEATDIEKKIDTQTYYENEERKYHSKAHDLRIEIQQDLGIGVEEYYQILREDG